MKLLRLVPKNLLRNPLRTLLTGLAVAASTFIFTALVSLDHGVKQMIEKSGGDLVITVFEKYKACPPYSRIPLHYGDQIRSIPHVTHVMPIRFLISNCQTTTDLVAVYGVEPGSLREFRKIELPPEEYEAFASERGAAIVGKAVAEKYRWRIGEPVTLKELRGISFVIRGIFSAPGTSLESVILVEREYLERSIQDVGQETMFVVKVDGPGAIDEVSSQIDALFANASTQTKSGPERSFIANAVEEFKEMVEFSQVVAYVALLLLLAAAANSVSMSVRDRMREIAIFKVLGFRRTQVMGLVILESTAVSLISAGAGVLAFMALTNWARLSIAVEGYTISPSFGIPTVGTALALGAILGAAGALLPALHGTRMPIVQALREVD